jgi:hypothetical protein
MLSLMKSAFCWVGLPTRLARRSVLWAVAFVVIVGCDSGASCPFDRPTCCDNALFGCGPFDIPQGCSCEDYFSRAFSGAPLQKKIMSGKIREVSTGGTWRISLKRTGAACAYLSEKITRTVLIRERRGNVTAKIVGFANLRGDRVGRNAKLRGQLKVPVSRCVANMVADFRLVSAPQALVTGTVTVQCKDARLTCDAAYSGIAKRL